MKYVITFFVWLCVLYFGVSNDLKREAELAQLREASLEPIQKAVLRYKRETRRKAMAVLDIDGSVTTYPTPAFITWLEGKSGLTATRRRVLLETPRPLPVDVLFSTVDPDELERLCKGVR